MRAVFQPKKELEKPGKQHLKHDQEEDDAGTPSKQDKKDEEQPAGESGDPSKDKENKSKEAAPEAPIGFFGQVGKCVLPQASLSAVHASVLCACACVIFLCHCHSLRTFNA